MNETILFSTTGAETSQWPSFEEQVVTAAVRYSNNPNEEAAFIAGAKWAHGGTSNIELVLYVFLAIFLVVQFIGVASGLIEGNVDSSDLTPTYDRSKWRYIIPTRNLAYRFSRWMSK